MTTEINFSDSMSVATTFATKLLAGTLNHYLDWENASSEMVEVKRDESWFSTDVIAWLRATTCNMEISRLVPTGIVENPDSMGTQGDIRSVTLFAYNSSGEEEQVATFNMKRDWLDGERATGWTSWSVTNVVVSVTGQEIELRSEDYEGGCYLSDVIWGREIKPEMEEHHV